MPIFKKHNYIFVSLDPVHVGAGGYRLSRVDNQIVREPGTNIPKVPGTSLSGAARSYAAVLYNKPEAAGQQKRLISREYIKCPILYTFGAASDTEQGVTKAGAVSVSDARVLFWPVPSTQGPLWVATPDSLRDAGFKFLEGGQPDDTGRIAVTFARGNGQLNVGWLRLEVVANQAKVTAPEKLQTKDLYKEISGRLVLVSPKYFAQIVNSNLEVRTSVSINPETGAAEKGLLFTYEAIPRGAWFFCEAVEDDYTGKFPKTTTRHLRDAQAPIELLPNLGGNALEWNEPLDVLRSGLGMIEYLGVGGMGTRGFGRMKMVGEWETAHA